MAEGGSWTEISPGEAYFQAALQMAQYQLILKEIPAQEECEEDSELDNRIQQLIDVQLKKRHRELARKSAFENLLKVMAIVVLVGNLFVTTAFALNTSFREMVNQLFISTYPTHSSIEVETNADAVRQNLSEDIPEFMLTWLPNDHYAVEDRTKSAFASSIVYTAEDGSYIILDICSNAVAGNVNTEDMDASVVRLDEKELHVFSGKGDTVVIWRDNNYYYVMYARGLSESEVLLSALSVCPITEE